MTLQLDAFTISVALWIVAALLAVFLLREMASRRPEAILRPHRTERPRRCVFCRRRRRDQ